MSNYYYAIRVSIGTLIVKILKTSKKV